MVLLSYNDISAADGFGTVFLAAICGLGALALIYAVLVIMNKIHEKKHSNEDAEKEENINDISEDEK